MPENPLKAAARQCFRWYLNRFPLRDGKARLYHLIHPHLLPPERFQVIVCDPGFRLKCDLHDPEQLKVYFYGHYHERYEARLIRQVLRPKDNFWDIGANIGYFSLLAAAALHHTGQVVAFEPGQAAFRQLQENINLNTFTHINAVNLAVADRVGEARLYLAPNLADTGATLYQGGASSGPYEVIRTISLDAFWRQEHPAPPHLLKVDVEGAELAVLQGAEQILSDFCPLLLLEMEAKNLRLAGTDKAAVQAWLTPRGYRAAFLHKGRWIAAADINKTRGRNIFWFNPDQPWHQEKIRALKIRGIAAG